MACLKKFRSLTVIQASPKMAPISKGIKSSLGGDGITSTTVTHMYTIHSYLLSIAAVTLSVVHLVALVYQERRNLHRVAAIQLATEAVAPDQEPDKELVASH